MPEKTNIIWEKEKHVKRTYSFDLSPKLSGKYMSKGIWSSDGSGEIGDRKLIFRTIRKATKSWTIYDAASEKELGKISFYWKDFQRSKLTLTSGKEFYFRSYDIFRGVWSWMQGESPLEQFVFRVDSPLHRSGLIENNSKGLSAEERDILLLLGLHLQHYINDWLMTLVIIVFVIVTGN